MDETASVTTEQAAPEAAKSVEPSSQDGDVQVSDQKESSNGNEQPQEENIPFGKHPRWIKMRESNKTLQSQIKETQEQLKALDGAKQLDAYLRQNPDKIKVVMDWMNGKSLAQAEAKSPVPEKDPYDDFDPIVAEQFRKQDAFEKKLADMEAAAQKRQEEERTSSLQKSVETVESRFSNLLVTDGFVDKNGKGDNALIELIADATLSRLAKVTDDPRFATEEQLIQAYKAVTSGLSAHQKFTLKKTVNPDVPLSGSNKGTIPAGKARMTEEERLSSIINSL